MLDVSTDELIERIKCKIMIKIQHLCTSGVKRLNLHCNFYYISHFVCLKYLNCCDVSDGCCPYMAGADRGSGYKSMKFCGRAGLTFSCESPQTPDG